MPYRDFQLHFCQTVVGLSNEGSEDPGDPSHPYQLSRYMVSWYCKENTPEAGLIIKSLDSAAHLKLLGIYISM